MSEYQKAPRKKTVLDHPKLVLSAPNPAVRGKYAKAYFDVWDNNPRLVVATQDPGFMTKEDNFGRITAPLSPQTFSILIEQIKQVADHQGETKIAGDVMSSWQGRPNDSDPKAPKLAATYVVGKNAEGCVYLSVIHHDKRWPRIQFIFGPDDQRWINYRDHTGEKLNRGLLSVIAAKAWANNWYKVVMDYIAQNYVHPEPRNPQGGNRGGYGGGNRGGYSGGGGGNRGGYGGGDRQNDAPAAAAPKPADDFEDDGIPY